MDFSLILVLILFVVMMVVIRMWFNKLEQRSGTSAEIVEWLKSSTLNVNSRLDNAAKLFAQVQKDIGEFSEIGRSMKELQDFLQSPKLRGNIGEQILADLLRQHFPTGSFTLQYVFSNGEKVDAVVKTSSGLIPIDSKFPMENFRKMMNEKVADVKERLKKEFVRDVKKHIQDIARKYINTGEGTGDYALMYIPSETVYYEIINDADLYDYAGSKRILPVSAMSFYAYMKAILMSYEGQKIQARAKEIAALLRAVKNDYEKLNESLGVLNKHITNASNQMSVVTKTSQSLGTKISSEVLSHGTDAKELNDEI